MFTLYLCNIYAGLKNNRLYTLSQIDNVKTGFSGVEHKFNRLYTPSQIDNVKTGFSGVEHKLSVHQNLA